MEKLVLCLVILCLGFETTTSINTKTGSKQCDVVIILVKTVYLHVCIFTQYINMLYVRQTSKGCG